ncbi:thiamine biosynthesis protein [Salmonella bongori]|nr:thiamine biosynthesis protein [Salmonella bongori]
MRNAPQCYRQKIQTQLDADDQLLSTYKKDSALMRFNHSRSLAPWPVSEAMADIVTSALRIGAKTDGAMDITVGPLVNFCGDLGRIGSRCISPLKRKSMRQKRKRPATFTGYRQG